MVQKVLELHFANLNGTLRPASLSRQKTLADNFYNRNSHLNIGC